MLSNLVTPRNAVSSLDEVQSPDFHNKWASFSPELQLLLICARLTLDEAQTTELKRLVSRSLDWQLICRRAEQHSLLSLLYQHLSRHCPQNVPARILSQLQNKFHNITRHNVGLAKEMLRLLYVLEAQGIQAVPYKGPIIAETIYGDLALRKFNDLDILVQPQDVLRAKEVLTEHGYDLDTTYWSTHEAKNPTKLRNRNVVNLKRSDGNVAIELHWRLCPPLFLTVDLAKLWPRLRTGTLLTKPVRTFAAEDLLNILCIHGAKDCWERLEWLVGVAELVRQQPNLDWATVFSWAEQIGSGRMLRLGLALARSLLAVDLPVNVRTKLYDDSTIETAGKKIIDSLTSDKHPPFGPVARWWFHLKLMPQFWQRLRFSFQLFYSVFEPTSIEKQRYCLPDRLFWLYYLLRPAGLVTKYASIWSRYLRAKLLQ